MVDKLFVEPRDADSVQLRTLARRQRKDDRLAAVLLSTYIIGKIFADNASAGIGFVAPPYGTELGFDAHTVSLLNALIIDRPQTGCIHCTNA